MFRFSRTTARTLTVTLLGASALFAVSACATSPSANQSSQTQQSDAAIWPRTIDIPAGDHSEASELTLTAEPQRIVTLDYESTEVVAALGASEKLVLIPEAVLNPALGGHVDELSAVDSTFPVAMEIDPEMIIAHAPDLVVYSPRHGTEAPIGAVLTQAGIPTLQLPDSWSNSDSLITNLQLISEATGHDADGAKLTETLKQGLTAATVEASEGAPQPRVLLLTNQAGRPFVTAGDAFPVELLERAGGENTASDLGFERTSPISAEHIITAAPDGVVLLDMNGTGDQMFEELLENPAISSLPAFENGNVLRLEGRSVQALGLTATIDGLSELATWVSTLPRS